jgi:hypothetical protein
LFIETFVSSGAAKLHAVMWREYQERARRRRRASRETRLPPQNNDDTDDEQQQQQQQQQQNDDEQPSQSSSLLSPTTVLADAALNNEAVVQQWESHDRNDGSLLDDLLRESVNEGKQWIDCLLLLCFLIELTCCCRSSQNSKEGFRQIIVEQH